MDKTLYSRVQDSILNYIKENNLEPDDKLPTFRELAKIFGASIYTISTAISNLQSLGILEVKPNAGVYVAHDALKEMFPDELPWEDHVCNHKILKSDTNRKYAFIKPRINMSYPFFCDEFGWFQVFDHAVKSALASIEKPDHLSNLKGAQGYMPLRREVSEHLKDYGIDASPKNIIISEGAFATRYLIAKVFLSEPAIYFVPSPSLEELSLSEKFTPGVEFVRVPFDEEGMSAEYIASKINRKKKALLLTSPIIQSNNGISMSMNRRKEIYNLCSKNNIPIIEMDEYRDFHPNPLPPLKAMDTRNIVIHIGTFERVLTRSIGVCWIAAPPRLVDDLVYVNSSLMQHFQVFNQMIAYEALRSGMYRRFTINIKEKLKQHYALFNALLDEYLGDIAKWDRASDIFFWLRFEEYIDVDRMAREAKDISFLSYSIYKFAPKNALWITPIRFSATELPSVLQKLSHLARKCIK